MSNLRVLRYNNQPGNTTMPAVVVQNDHQGRLAKAVPAVGAAAATDAKRLLLLMLPLENCQQKLGYSCCCC